MLKTVLVSSMLLTVALSTEILQFDNNLIEYGEYQPAQRISLPYPYHNMHDNEVVIETVPASVYSNTQGNVVVPSTTEVETAGFISTAISCTFDAIKAVLNFFLTNGPALLTGTALALGVCKLTSLCDSQVTIYEVQSELRSLATPERLARAAKFVKEAVNKYSRMQKNV